MSHDMHYGRRGSRIFLRHRHGVLKLMLSAIHRHKIRGIIVVRYHDRITDVHVQVFCMLFKVSLIKIRC